MNSVWTCPVAVAALTLACMFGACGDDERVDGNDAGPRPAASETLSELDAPGRRDACDAFAKRLDGLFTQPGYERLSCTRQAAPVSFQVSQDGMLGGNVELCEKLVSDCVKNGGALGEDPPAKTLSEDLLDAIRCNMGDQFKACSLSVSEFSRCTKAFAAQLGEGFRDVTCDSLRDPEAMERAFREIDPYAIAECEAFATECPNLVFDTNIDGHLPPQ